MIYTHTLGDMFTRITIIVVILSFLGCNHPYYDDYQRNKMKMVYVSDLDERKHIMEKAAIAFAQHNVSMEITSEIEARNLAYFYLEYTYAMLKGSISFFYGGGMVEFQDLSAVLENGVWQVYHKQKVVMQIRQSDGAILNMPGLGENAKQKRLTNEGFVYNAELAARRAFNMGGKGREWNTYEVFSYYSEVEQDIIWYVRILDEDVYTEIPYSADLVLQEDLGRVLIVLPDYLAIRQKDGVILNMSYMKRVHVANLSISDAKNMSYWEVLAWHEQEASLSDTLGMAEK